jgi:signal transduction histidine kinase
MEITFLATIMHELKTPLSCIKLGLMQLKDNRNGEMNRRQKELAGYINDEIERLFKIVNELLDRTQAESGRIRVKPIPTSPAAIVAHAIDSVKILAAQKEVDLQVIVPSGLSKVLGDVEKTGWVLVNFLSNALRYSIERSTIIIGLAEKNGRVIFSVQDFGKGIDEQYQKRLFERYFRVPTDNDNKAADSDNKGGSGLGLAISKEIIEAQGGEIWVESVSRKGSIFSFSLKQSI